MQCFFAKVAFIWQHGNNICQTTSQCHTIVAITSATTIKNHMSWKIPGVNISSDLEEPCLKLAKACLSTIKNLILLLRKSINLHLNKQNEKSIHAQIVDGVLHLVCAVYLRYTLLMFYFTFLKFYFSSIFI